MNRRSQHLRLWSEHSCSPALWMIRSFRTTFFESPKNIGPLISRRSSENKLLALEDILHDAHNRLLFRLPKSLLLLGAYATSADCGRAWCRGRLSSISYSRTHEDCRQPAD